MLAEKFVHTNFLIPFPADLEPLTSHSKNLTIEVENLLGHPNYGCKFFGKPEQLFDGKALRILVGNVEREHRLAKRDLNVTKKQIAELLLTHKESYTYRAKRGGMAAVTGALGIFGLGIGIGSAVGCGHILGSCNKKVKLNTERIQQANQKLRLLESAVIEVNDQLNDRLYMVGTELEAIRHAQDEFESAQNDNWLLVTKEIAALHNRTFYMMECDEMLHVHDFVLKEAIIIGNTLGNIFTNIKSYRVAIYAYKNNLITSLNTMLNNYIPMTLLPKEHLQKILEKLANEHFFSKDRLALAIPAKDILTYYETKLLTRVTSSEHGLLFTISIPLSSSETVMNVYEAQTIPMPTKGSESATIWDIESELIAVSANQDKIALLDEKDLQKCIGSNKIAVCHEVFATARTRKSCLATLMFQDTTQAIKVCSIKSIKLPVVETAKNLGRGRWLITSAMDGYILSQTAMNETNPLKTIKHKGCKVCILTLPCGHQAEGPNIEMRSDLSSCNNIPEVKIDIQLAKPLADLFSLLPTIEDMPHMPNLEFAQQQLVNDIQSKVAITPRREFLAKDQLLEIAKPIIIDFKTVKPEIGRKLNEIVSWKLTVFIAVVSFIMSFVGHGVFTYTVNKFSNVTRRFPYRSNNLGRKLKTRAVVAVSEEDFEFLNNAPTHPFHKYAIAIPLMKEEVKDDENGEGNAEPGRSYPQLARFVREMRNLNAPRV